MTLGPGVVGCVGLGVGCCVGVGLPGVVVGVGAFVGVADGLNEVGCCWVGNGAGVAAGAVRGKLARSSRAA